MTMSSGRDRIAPRPQNASRAARALRHPLWTAGTFVRGLAAAPVPALLGRAVSHLRTRIFPLRLTIPHRRWADTDESLAVRWAGPLNLRHRTLESLLCIPRAGIEYRTKAPAGSRFVCECGISPEVWQHAPPPVDFSIELEVPAANGWRAVRTLTLDPGSRWTDRRWHRVAIALPDVDGAAVDVVVTLATSLKDGRSTTNAWAIFGEPRFEASRSAAAIRGSVLTFARRLRQNGIGAAIELLRQTGVTTQDAETYARWVVRNTRSAADLAALAADVAALPYQPLISILVPVYNTDPRWLRAAIRSVEQQVYPRWQLCLCDDASTRPETVQLLRELETHPQMRITFLRENGGISRASNAALATATGDLVALLDHDDELPQDALAEVVRYFNAHPETDVVYSDEDKLDARGDRCDPYFKPDWSPEHFLSTMYTCHLMVMRRAVLDAAGGFRAGYEGAQDYDLLLRIIERTRRIGHIPRMLYHWRKHAESTASTAFAKTWALDSGRLALEDYVRRNAVDAEIVDGGLPGLYRLRRTIRGRPLVSIIIPTAGRLRDVNGRPVDILAQAIESIVSRTTYADYELIVVADAAGVPAPSERALAPARHQVLRFERPGPFNFSAKINYGAAHARGEHLLLFNDDLEVIVPEWLSAMLELSQEPAIGAVGPKLLYPDGRLQHIGMTLGVAGVAAHAFHQHPGVSPGYAGSALIIRNYSAVTGACLMTRRAIFDEVGRFDESFAIDFNDVDYCLRLRRAGYRVVYTPWARLYHHESASFGLRRQDLAELEEMRRRWADVIDHDPYYNPNLTRDFPDYRLDG
jgi:O-antigen biosynthesis protein